MVEKEEGKAICMIEIKPGGLMIFPYVKELQQIDGGGKWSVPLLKVQASATALLFDVQPREEKVGARALQRRTKQRRQRIKKKRREKTRTTILCSRTCFGRPTSEAGARAPV